MGEKQFWRPAMVCEICQQHRAEQRHHMFPQTKLNRKLYGKLLDSPKNIQELCYDCHQWKPIKHLTEREFCSILGIETRSKSGLL